MLTLVGMERVAVPEKTIGEQEMALVRYLAEAGEASVGEVSESYGAERGLTRSTVLTMMERLRRKKFLTRHSVRGVYKYRACMTSRELLTNAVRRFVERNLDGSVSPFVAYLSESANLSDAELQELQELVTKLQARPKK
jgi:predicted transcriptional regulator